MIIAINNENNSNDIDLRKDNDDNKDISDISTHAGTKLLVKYT